MGLGKKGESFLDATIAIVAIGMVAYQAVSTQTLLLGSKLNLHTHLSFALVLSFLVLIRREKKWNYGWIVPLIASLVAIAYIFAFHDEIQERNLFNNTMDLIVGVILISVALIACWKGFGGVLSVFALVCILYFALCNYIPGAFHGPKYSMFRLIPTLSISLNSGMYGLVLSVSANQIFLFMVFGGLLQASGAIKFFIEVGKIAGRKLAGGPAMAAVVSSGLVGMCSGSVAANVAICGAFTIPAMKKVGYKPDQAGAIEALASTGGQIMPPVMGVAAFGLAAFTGVSYFRVCIASMLPAILYYLAVGLAAEQWAHKLRISRTMFKEKVDVKVLRATTPCFVIPLVVLVVLMALDYSPQFSISWTIVALLVTSSISKETRFTWAKLRDGLVNGAISGAQIATASATIGFIITTFSETGLALKLPFLIESIAGGNLAFFSILVFFIALLCGCGMPTMAVYFTVATICAPILIRMGIPLLSAHLFVMFAGVYSSITPPVAIGTMVAARLAGGDFIKTSIYAIRLSGIAYLLPFLILISKALTLQENSLIEWMKVADCFLLVFYTSIVIERYWLKKVTFGKWWLGLMSLGFGFAFLVTSDYWTFAVSIGAFILLTLWQIKDRGANTEVSAPHLS